jgi:hypothetical protein
MAEYRLRCSAGVDRRAVVDLVGIALVADIRKDDLTWARPVADEQARIDSLLTSRWPSLAIRKAEPVPAGRVLAAIGVVRPRGCLARPGQKR